MSKRNDEKKKKLAFRTDFPSRNAEASSPQTPSSSNEEGCDFLFTEIGHLNLTSVEWGLESDLLGELFPSEKIRKPNRKVDKILTVGERVQRGMSIHQEVSAVTQIYGRLFTCTITNIL